MHGKKGSKAIRETWMKASCFMMWFDDEHQPTAKSEAIGARLVTAFGVDLPNAARLDTEEESHIVSEMGNALTI